MISGIIVLVSFPFTNRTSTKQRLAAIISTAAYNNIKPDLIIMAVNKLLQQTIKFILG